MRQFYTTAEATENSFLFISYSHDDQETVQAWADYLIDRGVRVWWDKAFMGGDDWETIATTLLSHENCCGILFFGSKSAIGSPNVAKEWRRATRTKESRADGCFYSQIIMTTDDPALDYKYLTNFVKKTEELFSDDDYDDFRTLFGKKDHLYYCAAKEADKEALLQTIKSRVPHAVDEHEIIRGKLADLSNLDKDVILSIGTYGANRKPLMWRQICQENNEATLLCQDVLGEELGGDQLSSWLNSFLQQNFSPEEQETLRGNLRILTAEKAAEVPQTYLAADKLWWLADCDGHLQAVVREDGTIYHSGYNNILYKKGIRPAITLDITVLYSLFNK